MHREEGVSWGHMQEKGHRGHMEVGEGEGIRGLIVLKKFLVNFISSKSIFHSPDPVYIVWSKIW